MNRNGVQERWIPRPEGFIFLFLCVQLLVGLTALAKPYAPSSDETIVETLPRTTPGAPSRTRGPVASSKDMASAVAEATNHLSMARASGDPRYLGYAQASLQRWWRSRTPAPAVALLRAQIHQHNHDFSAALADLDYAARDPRNAQVHLTRAAIYQVQGNYGAAETECRRLALLAPPLTTADCLSRVISHRGRAREAYDRLLALRDRSSDADRDQLREVDLTLADIAVRLGDDRAARLHYRSAVDAGADSYALAAWADFLLDQHEVRAVLALLQQYADHPDLLLRAAIAAREAAAPDGPVLVARLRSQYTAQQRRGDFAPSRDYARFLLEIEPDARAALAAALSNWRTQREPADARIVLAAALASGRVEAAAPVIDFIRRNQLEDVRLEELLSSIGRAGPSSAVRTTAVAP